MNYIKLKKHTQMYPWNIFKTVAKHLQCLVKGGGESQWAKKRQINAFIWENKTYNCFTGQFIWALFFCKRQDMSTMKYTKNALNEGLNLKGLILFAGIYQIGDPGYLLIVWENSTCSSKCWSSFQQHASFNSQASWRSLWAIKSSLETYHCLTTRKCSSSDFSFSALCNFCCVDSFSRIKNS